MNFRGNFFGRCCSAVGAVYDRAQLIGLQPRMVHLRNFVRGHRPRLQYRYRLARMSEDLERLFNLSLDMLCIAGFDGYFKRLNPAWERVLGFSEAELLSRPYVEFVHPDDRAATQAEASKIETGARLLWFENRYLCRDGSWRWLLWNAVPYARESLIYAAARDIDDLKRSESRLAADHAVTRVLAESPTLE